MSLLDTASLIVTPNGYKEGKLYSVIPSDGSGDLSVTRATTATRVNSQGLVELVPYNLAQYSEQFDNAYWTKLNASITANATTAPNGSLTADKLVENTALNSHRFLSTAIETIASNQYTISIYLKAAERNYAYVRLNNSGGDIATANIDLVNGVVSQSVIGTFVVTSVGNGWFRVNGTGTSASSSNAYIEVRTSNSATYANYTGDGVSGIYTWGAQLNEGALKDYQKTETRLNIPRLDYSNGTCPSILVEPQRTNLNLYSEDLSNAWYSKFNSSISTNTTTAPSGISNADKIIENTNNSFHYVETVNSLSAGQSYTISAYLKKAERDFGYIGIYTFESKQIRVDLVNGTIDNTTGTWINTKIEDAGNGWYRVIGTFDAYSSSYFFAGPALNATTVTYTGNGTSGVYLWGAQLELGSYATSYIPTTSASVTRNADVISKTGISSLIGQTEGVAYIDFDFNSKITSNGVMAFSIDGGAGNEMYILIYSNGNIVWEMYNSGLAQGSITGNIGSFGRKKIALAYKLNDCALYSNGTLIGTDTAATIPAMSRVYLGRFYSSTAYNLSAGINSFVLWKTRLTNTQLAQLTTI